MMKGKGDCFEIAGLIALRDFQTVPKREKQDSPRSIASKGLMPSKEKWMGTPYVVHAQVIGEGALEGIPYGHAWIEDDVFVYDFSNGRQIQKLNDDYYFRGKVSFEKPKYFKYTFEQARNKMLETGHFGSWDLKTDSGL